MRLKGFVVVKPATSPGECQIRYNEIVVIKQIGDASWGSSKIEYRSNGGGTCELMLDSSYTTVLIRIQQAQEEDEPGQAGEDQG